MTDSFHTYKIILKKLKLIFLFCLFPVSSSAYEPEVYVLAFQLQDNWTILVEQTSDRYLQRVQETELNDFDSDQSAEIMKMLRSDLLERIGWGRLGDKLLANLTETCGGDFLDSMVEVFAGLEVPDEQRESMANQYEKCATVSFDGSMQLVKEQIIEFSRDKARIIDQARGIDG